jgi:hypothetical protein
MKILTLIMSIILLSSCASQSAYRAASGNGYGYQEVKLSDTQYRISFKLRGSNVAKAKDLALVRAADLTLQHGYTWFQVIDKEMTREKSDDSSLTIGASRETTTTTSCGLLTCQSRTTPSTGYHAAAELGADRDKVERLLEIRMGKGVQPQDGRSYNAKQLKANLAAQYDLKS